jgi:hypothetical protein
MSSTHSKAAAFALIPAYLALVACSGLSSSGGGQSLNCCIIQKLIQACPDAYDSSAASIAQAGDDEACQTWLDDTPEGASGRSCVNGLGTPIETVDQATAACTQ